MKKNIRLILLLELLLFIVVFLVLVTNITPRGLHNISNFIDIPSFLIIMLILIPGLIIMGEWKDFIKSFSVGIKDFNLLELKNIILAVDAAQKLTIYAALFSIISSAIIILIKLSTNSQLIGPNLAVCFLSGFYAIIIEFLLLPLRLNAERKMNEEMDFEDESI
ncbi:MAG: hypothetical protein K6F30_03545 [Lachnospiraceae bacterium]|nr:hypothetical protein [Lachnospiraceae bacterium]